MEYYKKAANQGSIAAQHNIGSILCLGFEGQAPNSKEALNWFKKAANKGFEISQFKVGHILSEGFDNIPPDQEEALHYYLQAAQKNYAPALIKAAVIFCGRKNPEDDQKALEFFKRVVKKNAQEKGHAFCGMGFILRYKIDKQTSDSSEAYKYFSKAISDPNIDMKCKAASLFEMGLLLEEGFEGQKPNLKEALKYYLQAAQQNSATAQHRVALWYFNQKDNSLKYQKIALYFLLQSARQEYAPAMIMLAYYHMLIDDEPNKSLFWLEKAHALNEPLADRHLKLIDSLYLSSQNELSNGEEEEIQDLLKASFQPEKQSRSNFINNLKFENIIEETKNTSSLEVTTETFAWSDSAHSKEIQKVEIQENSNDLFHDNINDIFSQETLIPKDLSFTISNPKYIREQMKKLGDLKKSYKTAEESSSKTLESKNQKIVEKIKHPQNNGFNFKDLEKLFKDPYFAGQVIMYDTKNGKMISAHNKITGNHFTISTHQGHFKNINHEVPKAFIADISKILGIFNI